MLDIKATALSIEDGGILSECLARASRADDIPRALKTYERVQKGRAEKVKKAAEVSGVFKTLTEGSEQRRRDDGLAKRLEKGGKYEFWRASGHLEWIYGWDFRRECKKGLDRVFSVERRTGEKARI